MSRRKVFRRIVKIDEDRCDGCGLCIPACPEGALRIIDGKAKLVSEAVCDGLGACVKECPKGAIILEEREAEPFEAELPHGHAADVKLNWPIKLELVNPRSPAIGDKELLVVADCVPFVYSSFKKDFQGFIASGCPMFGDTSLYRDKVAGILKHNQVASVRVVRMEVPCCSKLTDVASEASKKAGRRIRLEEDVIGIDGSFISKRVLEGVG
ncbi:MAG: 4Fe-4S binding protein [Candidatus Nezhaarchaeota archaeon]|nr:4Fe-4S binding protein [Candidatus Nezhaarchaeota archaeon]